MVRNVLTYGVLAVVSASVSSAVVVGPPAVLAGKPSKFAVKIIRDEAYEPLVYASAQYTSFSFCTRALMRAEAPAL